MNEKQTRTLIQAFNVYPNSHCNISNFRKLSEVVIDLYNERKSLKEIIKELKMEIRNIKYSPGMKVCVIKELREKQPPFNENFINLEITGYRIYTGIIKFTEFNPDTNEFLITIDGIAGKYTEGDIYPDFQEAKKALDKKMGKSDE